MRYIYSTIFTLSLFISRLERSQQNLFCDRYDSTFNKQLCPFYVHYFVSVYRCKVMFEVIQSISFNLNPGPAIHKYTAIGSCSTRSYRCGNSGTSEEVSTCSERDWLRNSSYVVVMEHNVIVRWKSSLSAAEGFLQGRWISSFSIKETKILFFRFEDKHVVNS